MMFYTFSTMAILAVICLFLYPTFNKIVSQLNGDQATYVTVECYTKVIIALLLSSLSAIILGNVVARNGLKRIREFEDKMENITADSLHERINLNDWPKELKTLGIRFNMMLDRIQSSFIQLSQFSSDIAHELRNPINNLRGLTEIALTKEEIPKEYRKLLESYMDEYHHLSKLIENLLFLARSDHGQIIINKKSFNAREEILKIFEYYQAIADENEIELICDGDAPLSADPILFKRVISNLLSNAIRYTERNGKITIMTKPLDNQFVHISIHDNGIGIADEHIARIFDRFYRVDPSRSSRSGGLGLGLAIVKSIIDLHRGKISVESKSNLGTSVYLRLPSPSLS